MKTLDTTLNNLLIPDLPTYSQGFGTKKTDGKGLSTEEVAKNIALPFSKQRPFIISEDTETTDIEANSLFIFSQPETVTLKLNNASFLGLEVQVINNSEVLQNLAFMVNDELKSFEVLPKTRFTTQWLGNGWFDSIPTANENLRGKVGLVSGQPTNENIMFDTDFAQTPKYIFNLLTGNAQGEINEILSNNGYETNFDEFGTGYIKFGDFKIQTVDMPQGSERERNYPIPFEYPPFFASSISFSFFFDGTQVSYVAEDSIFNVTTTGFTNLRPDKKHYRAFFMGI